MQTWILKSVQSENTKKTQTKDTILTKWEEKMRIWLSFLYKRRCYPSNEVSDLESALGKIKNLAPASLVGLLVVDKMVPGKSTQGQFSKVIFSFHRYLFRNSNQSTQSLRRNKIARRDSTSNRHWIVWIFLWKWIVFIE